ncbi:MAG: type II secretion system protein GspK [Candidatus Omnitrophica bacterium]|nr:type II secretion system protein GspK [Candidatus Omnitrophota bacterium]
MQNKKGSILLISSWVLLILVVLAIGLGHRSSIALRLCAYQRDNLKASYLAKAGINQAILQLKEDASFPYNSLKSIWSTGVDPLTSKPLFENVQIRDGSGEKFTVRYPYDDINYLCMLDEERKININKVVTGLIFQPLLGQLILTRLFDFAGAANPDDLKNLVVKWIDPAADIGDDPDQIFKNSNLQTTEELLPILEFFYKEEGNPALKAKQIYGKIKDLITVYGDGKININTAKEETLGILINACIDECVKNGVITVRPDPQNLINLISIIRKDAPFENLGALSNALASTSNLSSEEKNVLNKLTEIITFKSNNFRINSTGEIIGKSISKTITCIFSRTGNKIIYWHEN